MFEKPVCESCLRQFEKIRQAKLETTTLDESQKCLWCMIYTRLAIVTDLDDVDNLNIKEAQKVE